jgi:hypothetical protein
LAPSFEAPLQAGGLRAVLATFDLAKQPPLLLPPVQAPARGRCDAARRAAQARGNAARTTEPRGPNALCPKGQGSTGSRRFSVGRMSRLRKSSGRGERSPRGGFTRSRVWGSRAPKARRSGSRQERPGVVRPITRAAFSGARGTRTRCRPSHTSAITLPCPTPSRAQAREKSHGANWNATCSVGMSWTSRNWPL